MNFHPITEAFPLLEGKEFTDLCDDIQANGLRCPIWTYEGQVIDGRNRYRACDARNVSPTFQEWDGLGSLAAFVASLNVHRRHLSPSQRALAGAKLLPYFTEDAKRRMLRGKTDPSAPVRQGKAAEQAAAAVQTSTRAVEQAHKVLEQGTPELTDAVRSHQVTLKQAAKLADLPPERQREEIERTESRVSAAREHDERSERIARCLKRIDRLILDTGGLGGESDRVVACLEEAKQELHNLG
jgi:hypothetical protein